MGSINLDNTGSGGAITLSSDGTSLLLDGSAVSGDTLKAIAKDISDTAVDVFVYDTRKDSDGGAWRKRTQHTSWYNETLNTATRGARKEFPAVAVIVAESNQVTIYDGDDPDMPMWMVFNQGSNYKTYLARTQAPVTCVSCLNGTFTVGRGNGGYDEALLVASFISDSAKNYGNSANSTWTLLDDVANRNTGTEIALDPDFGQIISLEIYDVTMTVLPNAPIDSATGLPVPTIAVATTGGYSIIKDDGSVVDGTCSQANHQKVEKIVFTQDNMLFYGGFDYVSQNRSRLYRVDNILSADTVLSTTNHTPGNSPELYGFTTTIPANDKTLVVDVAEGATNNYLSDPHLAFSDNELRFANLNGLYKVARNKTLPSAGLANKITSDYNTGWMSGNIKLATLSDTDDTNVTGAELVTNGTFDSNVTGWTNADASSFTYDAGEARVASNSGWQTVYQAITTVVGKTYVITADVTANSNIVDLWIGTAGTGSLANRYALGGSGNITGTGPMSATITATGTTTFVHLAVYNGTADFDNVTARLAEADRSVNGKDLQVFGTVTKSAVATGADLMAYSGFSGSNYLKQPYNSGLDFGTGDFSYMAWFKFNDIATTYGLFSRQVAGQSSGNRWQVQTDTSSGGSLALYNGGNIGNIGFSLSEGIGNWMLFAIFKKNDRIYASVNGKTPVYLGGDTTNYTNSGADFVVAGLNLVDANNIGYALNGSVALVRVSATAPSAEQIAKIYEDEKVLFQENAKATLYGSSDAVTALAYDDDTELLHVGTSAGRSVFQGLRRIDNTTDAVGAAISASNGMVAED